MNCLEILAARSLSHKTSIFASFSHECLQEDFRIFCYDFATSLPVPEHFFEGGFVKIGTTLGEI